MNQEVFETVLNDILQELQEGNRLKRQLDQQVQTLKEKVDGFEQRLADIRVVAPAVDIAPLQQLIKEGTENITALVSSHLEKTNGIIEEKIRKFMAGIEDQPKPIVRQWRILFFPENDYSGTFRIFLNRVCGWGTLLVLIAALFTLGQDYINRPRDPNPSYTGNGFHTMQFPGSKASNPNPNLSPNSGANPGSGKTRHPRQQKHPKPSADSLSGSPGPTSSDSLP